MSQPFFVEKLPLSLPICIKEECLTIPRFNGRKASFCCFYIFCKARRFKRLLVKEVKLRILDRQLPIFELVELFGSGLGGGWRRNRISLEILFPLFVALDRLFYKLLMDFCVFFEKFIAGFFKVVPIFFRVLFGKNCNFFHSIAEYCSKRKFHSFK